MIAILGVRLGIQFNIQFGTRFAEHCKQKESTFDARNDALANRGRATAEEAQLAERRTVQKRSRISNLIKGVCGDEFAARKLFAQNVLAELKRKTRFALLFKSIIHWSIERTGSVRPNHRLQSELPNLLVETRSMDLLAGAQ